MSEAALQFIENSGFKFIGDTHPKIKQAKGIIANTKPNPFKLFAAEGIWAQNKIFESGTRVDSIIVCAECIHTPEALECLKKLTEKTLERYAVSYKVYEKLSERDKPDGLFCLAYLPMYSPEDIRVRLNDKSVLLVLDGIEIPGNVGTMLRMADGAGLDAVLICNKRARMTHPKLVKGSMGALLTVPWCEFKEVDECRAFLERNNIEYYLADTRATLSYYEEPFGKACALVMGSERYGITRSWYTDKAKMISIPMLGKCDSLNVGVAATVLCYEATIKNKLKGERLSRA